MSDANRPPCKSATHVVELITRPTASAQAQQTVERSISEYTLARPTIVRSLPTLCGFAANFDDEDGSTGDTGKTRFQMMLP